MWLQHNPPESNSPTLTVIEWVAFVCKCLSTEASMAAGVQNTNQTKSPTYTCSTEQIKLLANKHRSGKHAVIKHRHIHAETNPYTLNFDLWQEIFRLSLLSEHVVLLNFSFTLCLWSIYVCLVSAVLPQACMPTDGLQCLNELGDFIYTSICTFNERVDINVQ